MEEGHDEDDGVPKIQLLIHGMKSYYALLREAYWGEAAIKAAIFVLLVAITHFVMVWALYNVVLPYVQMYFYDSIIDEATRRLEETDWGKGFASMRIPRF